MATTTCWDSLETRGYVILRRPDIPCLKICDTILDSLNEKTKYGEISGGYLQTDVESHPQANELKKLIYDMIEPELRLVKGENDIKHLKFLIAPFGSGPQCPHRDGLSKDNFVVALYLTPTQSTAMSRFYVGGGYSTEQMIKHKDVRLLKGWNHSIHEIKESFDLESLDQTSNEIAPNTYAADNHLQQSLQSPKDKTLDGFVSYQVQPGDMMVFHEDTIHFGIKNQDPTQNDRIVLFCVLGPKNKKHTDYYQYFEWLEYRHIFGDKSPQYKESLRRNLMFDPANHEATVSSKRKMQQLINKIDEDSKDSKKKQKKSK